jgi:hypothetical protein
MTNNTQKNTTGGSNRIIPERKSDGVAGPSRAVPGDASGAADDCNVNNHETDVEFLRMAQRLIERDAAVSDVADDCNVNNHEPDVEFLRMAQRLIERDASGAADAGQENNQQQDAEIVDTAPQLITRVASGAADAGQENNHKPHKKTKNTPPLLVKQEASAPGAVDAGHKNNHEQVEETGDTAPRLVERATALRCRSICSAKDSKSTCRKRTERDLHYPDAEVPYIKTEHAIRALVCSLMERQDRMNEAIFLKLNDLEYRVDDFELCKKPRTTKQPGSGKETQN